jgi:hypothetical protein
MTNPSSTQTEKLQALLEREAISDVLKFYCRALDRRDRALMERVYWPDAIDDHATFRGTAAQFIDYAFAHTAGMTTSHMISNILIELRGPTASFSECYFSAYHNFATATGRMDRTVGGRYLDLFEKRGDEWRIIRRVVCVDWYTEHPATSVWESGRYANLPARGKAKPDDPLYAFSVPGHGPDASMQSAEDSRFERKQGDGFPAGSQG